MLIEWVTEAEFTPQQLAEFEEVECIFSKGRSVRAVVRICLTSALCRNNRYEEVEEALNGGFSADTRDKFGNTMLMIACQNGLKRIAKLSLRHGGSMNIVNVSSMLVCHCVDNSD